MNTDTNEQIEALSQQMEKLLALVDFYAQQNTVLQQKNTQLLKKNEHHLSQKKQIQNTLSELKNLEQYIYSISKNNG